MRADPRSGVTDRVTPARQGLRRCARDGPASQHEPGDGRAVRPRRTRHPGHRYSGLPDLMSSSSADGRPARDPYAVFRPRRGRGVALVMAVLSLVIFTGGAISLPVVDPLYGGWDLLDRFFLVLCGVAVAAALWRYASIRATPSPEGLVIRNLITTRKLEWAQIVRVQFGGGAPWVSVDLDDTDTVAVMAIQKADGALAPAEAARLSALVQVHGRPPTV